MPRRKTKSEELGSSLAGAFLKNKDEKLLTQGRKVGRPPAENKKVRLNFLFDEEVVNDLRALAVLEQKTLTAIINECLKEKLEARRRDINIIRSIQSH